MADQDQDDFDEIFTDDIDEVPPELEVKEKEPEAEPEKVAKEPDPEPEVKIEAEPAQSTEVDPDPEPDKKPAHMVPLPELLEERKARQALEKQATESAATVQALQAQMQSIQTAMLSQGAANQPQPEPIDPFEDPEGFKNSIVTQMKQQNFNDLLSLSETTARRHYGSGVVDKAIAAVQASGQLNQFLSQPDPAGAIVEWHKNQQVIHEVGGDLTSYREKLTAELKQSVRDEILVELGMKPKSGNGAATIPASITDATSTAENGTVVPSDAQVFDDIFK